MSNDDLIELAKEAGAEWHRTASTQAQKYTDKVLIMSVDELVVFASLIVAKQSARIAELEALLARFEVIGVIPDCDMRGNPYARFDKVVPLGTKLFALKDEK
jgi:hypothetical protein